ncbi:peptidoglycan recognition family protein [Schaalia sp. ZJ1691]|uniref:peptidoglycan recognition protein family protein n=1 Tax=Schaalia sp. ZJ1691 TaxID=2709404 RepID=UPI002406BB85|nr:peptidoglycan recognition family protein [Schaalia sp. ZJ1691]
MVNAAVTDTAWSALFTPGRPYGPPLFIYMHHWGTDGQRHQDVVNFLRRWDGNSSAHYVASAGRVTQLVRDEDMAWHAGPAGNPRGIGIECRPEMSPADFETVARLIASIRKQWGPLSLRGHRDVMATACPGRWYAQLARLDQRARAYQTGKATYTKPAANLPRPQRKGQNEMLMIHIPTKPGSKEYLYGILGPNFFLRFTGVTVANGFARQIGSSSVEVNQAFWEHCAKAALTGTNIPETDLKKLGINPEDIIR